jgi:5-methylcytosine-specific restriction endonuclease McrA
MKIDKRGVRYEARFSVHDGKEVLLCSGCGAYQEPSEFYWIQARQKYHSRCRSCRKGKYIPVEYDRRHDNGIRLASAARDRRFDEAAGTWLCTKCGVHKGVGDYYPVKSKLGSPASNCIECAKSSHRAWSDRVMAETAQAREAMKEARRMERGVAKGARTLECGRCGQTKTMAEWPREGKSNRPLKYCCSEKVRSREDVARDMERQMKVCGTCNVDKPFMDYSPNKNAKDGRQSTCKPCRSAKVHSGEWAGGRRSELIAERSDGTLTVEVLNKKYSVKVCPCCDGYMERDDKVLDHIIPLKLGGPHSADNTTVMCWSCNSAKAATHPARWLLLLKPEAAARMRKHYSKMGLNFDG